MGRDILYHCHSLDHCYGYSNVENQQDERKWRVKLAQALIKSPENKKNRFKLGYLGKSTHFLFCHSSLACVKV